MQRRKPLKRTRRRKSEAEKQAAARFRAEVCGPLRCFFCDQQRRDEQLDAAHLISAQTLRAHTSTLPDADRWPIVYEPRLGVPACTIKPAGLDLNHCHARFDGCCIGFNGKRVLLGDLPSRAIAAAEEHKIMHLLERRFGDRV